jgi:hypothetical protein
MAQDQVQDQEDDAPSGGRSAQFQGGVSGGGLGTHIASALPQVKQVSPDFDASDSTLMIPNSMRTVNGVSNSSYMNQQLPYASKSSPMAKAQQGEESGKIE